MFLYASITGLSESSSAPHSTSNPTAQAVSAARVSPASGTRARDAPSPITSSVHRASQLATLILCPRSATPSSFHFCANCVARDKGMSAPKRTDTARHTHLLRRLEEERQEGAELRRGEPRVHDLADARVVLVCARRRQPGCASDSRRAAATANGAAGSGGRAGRTVGEEDAGAGDLARELARLLRLVEAVAGLVQDVLQRLPQRAVRRCARTSLELERLRRTFGSETSRTSFCRYSWLELYDTGRTGATHPQAALDTPHRPIFLRPLRGEVSNFLLMVQLFCMAYRRHIQMSGACASLGEG